MYSGTNSNFRYYLLSNNGLVKTDSLNVDGTSTLATTTSNTFNCPFISADTIQQRSSQLNIKSISNTSQISVSDSSIALVSSSGVIQTTSAGSINTSTQTLRNYPITISYLTT